MILRRLKREDAEGMLEWMHDKDICKNFREGIEHKTAEDVYKFIENADYTIRNEANLHFAVVDEKDEYMGTISLKNLNLKDQNAEYAISLRKSAQRKGLAAKATLGLFKYAFEDIGLHKIYLNVLEENIHAIHFYEKIGFCLEGTAKDHLFLRGKYQNLRWYSITAEMYCTLKPMKGE